MIWPENPSLFSCTGLRRDRPEKSAMDFLQVLTTVGPDTLSVIYGNGFREEFLFS